MSFAGLRQRAGAILFDLPRYLRCILFERKWAAYCNRGDQYSVRASPFGLRLKQGHTSSLHLCNQWPIIGRDLMKRALEEWPVRLAKDVVFSERPDVSFIIPHRGKQREELLIATIRSIAASRDVAVECLVVEQSAAPDLGELPGNCRRIHAPSRIPGDPWHKTLAHNVGVQNARADIVVFHDGDILVPEDYALTVMALLGESKMDVAFCQRFLFCLTENSTRGLVHRDLPAIVSSEELVEIRQNWVGGTLAIRRQKYSEIGGFDEEFVGWTGEDTEFHDRCLTLNGWFWGFIPFVHLWHLPQTEKVEPAREQQEEFTRRKLDQYREWRIRTLRDRGHGG